MHIVLGATGNVGSVVLKELLRAGEEVLAVTHSTRRVEELRQLGAEVAVADINDAKTLKQIFSRGKTAFLLNPPGDVTKDSAQEEMNSIRSIIDAVHNSSFQHVTVASTQGAQRGERIGDLGSLFELEEGIRATKVSATIVRAGFYMSNWSPQAPNAKEGKIQSFFPRDFKMPMIAPQDIGKFHARKLMEPPPNDFEIFDLNGPDEYSAQDVADAFSQIFNRAVEIEVTPQPKWMETFESFGFSKESAQSYARMSEIALKRAYESSIQSLRGAVTLSDYLNETCNRSQS